MTFEADTTNPAAGATVTRYHEEFYSPEVVIPDSVNIDSRPSDVRRIGDSAFWDQGSTRVILPSSLRNIDDHAFSGNHLSSIDIPDSLTQIGASAFSGSLLASVALSNSVMTIGEAAFSSNNLTSVTIPNSVTTINRTAFADNSLETVSIPASITWQGYTAAQATHIVTFDTGNGAVVGNVIVDHEEPLLEPDAPTREGHTFTGWYTDSATETEYDFTTPVTGDITVYAAWDQSTAPVASDGPPTDGTSRYETGSSVPETGGSVSAGVLTAALFGIIGGTILLLARRRTAPNRETNR